MFATRVYIISLCMVLFYLVEPGSTLFSWHPVFMTSGFVLVMFEGVLMLVPKRGLLNGAEFETRKNVHGILQSVGFFLFFVGFSAVAMTKIHNKKPHFDTMHSAIGCAAGVLSGFQIAGGFSTRFQRLTPMSPEYKKFGHTILGLIQFFVCTIALITGIYTDYFTKRSTPFIQVMLTTLPMFACGTAFSHVANKLLRMVLQPK